MYTVEQIRAAVERPEEDEFELTRPNPDRHSGKEFATVGWDDFYSNTGFIVGENGEFIDYELVETTGGEGKGDEASIVIKIGDQYFRKEGYYASHYGYDWDGDLEEVRPKVVERVEYFAD